MSRITVGGTIAPPLVVSAKGGSASGGQWTPVVHASRDYGARSARSVNVVLIKFVLHIDTLSSFNG